MFGLFKKKTGKEEKKAEPSYPLLDAEKMIAGIKERTNAPVYRIRVENREAGILDSKFGGYPYWEEGLFYPETKEGEKLLLLAQINFSKGHFDEGLLPQKGILQFYAADDDVTGLNFEDATLQDTFRIVYHENPDAGMTEEMVKKIGIPANTDTDHADSYFPFHYEKAISFEKGTDDMGISVEGFAEVFAALYAECIGEDLPEDAAWWDFVSDEGMNLFDEKLSNWGHKMLGYPAFTQSDPRGNPKEYDVLLFQMDSQDDIMWGDCGICNFFISSEKLKALDFSDVIYNWDCY